MGRRQDLEKRQALLSQFGRLIAAEKRLDNLLSIIAGEVRKIISADRCTVYLLDHYKGELWTKVSSGGEDRILRLPLGRGVAGFVAKTGSAVNLRDGYRDSRFTYELDELTGYKTKSVLAIPLKGAEGRVLGVLEVLNKTKGAFTEEDEGLLRILATMAASFLENATLYDELRRSHLETIYRMALVAEFRDQKDTARHLRRMSRFAEILARESGLGRDRAEDIRYAAPLHDVGKVAIPDSILLKPGALTPEEYEEMKKHTIYGSQMLANAESRLLRLAASIAVAHHERYDGTGYPYGLKGEKIPVEARIVSVADVFDALVSKRVYKGAWDIDEAIKYLLAQAGKLFDPRVVEVLDRRKDDIMQALEEENRLLAQGEAFEARLHETGAQFIKHHLKT